MDLIIDSREAKLKEYFDSINDEVTKLDINITYQNLNLGDIILKCNDIELIIERKTIYDLFSSIQDGRYKEQKYRLLKHYDLSQIVYLIEDVANVSKVKYLRNFSSITYGSIVNTIFRDNIKVVRSFSLNESATYILNILKKMNKNPEFFNSLNKTQTNQDIQEKTHQTNNDYVDNFKLKKSSEMTPQNCAIIQLSVIPGMSVHMAKIILTQYGSLVKLIQAYQHIEDLDSKKNMLATIEFDIKNNKKRKLGKVLSERVYQYLHC